MDFWTNVKITILLPIEVGDRKSPFYIYALEIFVTFRNLSQSLGKYHEILMRISRVKTRFDNHQHFFENMSPDFILVILLCLLGILWFNYFRQFVVFKLAYFLPMCFYNRCQVIQDEISCHNIDWNNIQQYHSQIEIPNPKNLPHKIQLKIDIVFSTKQLNHLFIQDIDPFLKVCILLIITIFQYMHFHACKVVIQKFFTLAQILR